MGVVPIALSDFRSQSARLSELHLASVGVSEFRCECIIKVLLVIHQNIGIPLEMRLTVEALLHMSDYWIST